MDLSADCIKSLTSIALAGGAVALGLSGIGLVAGALEGLVAGGALLVDLNEAQRQPLKEIERKLERAIRKNTAAWLASSQSAARNEADVEAALDGLSAALARVRLTVADMALPATQFASTLRARLPKDSLYRTSDMAGGLFATMVGGARSLAIQEPELQALFAHERWEATLSLLDAAQRDRDVKHQELLARFNALSAQLAEEKGLSVGELEPLFHAAGREMPSGSDRDLKRLVGEAVEALKARALAAPGAFNDRREIVDAIAAARARLRVADSKGALRALDTAYVEEMAALGELERLAAARKKGAARLKREEAEILKIGFRWEAAQLALTAAAELDPDGPWDWIEIGDIHAMRGRLEAATASYRNGRDAAAGLGLDRVVCAGHDRIGEVHLRQGNLSAAREAFEMQLAIAERHVAEDPGGTDWQRELSISQVKLGDLLVRQGEPGAARDAYGKALAIRERLAATDPGHPEWQRDLMNVHNRLGDVLVRQGQLRAAVDAYGKGLALAEQIAAAAPERAEWQRDLVVGHSKLGDALVQLGELDAVRREYDAARAVAVRLVDLDPEHTGWQLDLSFSHEKLADVLIKDGDLVGAHAACEAARSIRQRLTALDPTNLDWQHDLAISEWKLGNVLGRMGQLQVARHAYEAGLATAERLVAAQPDHLDWQRDLSVGLSMFGDLLAEAGEPALALTTFERGLAIRQRLVAADPTSSAWQRDLIIAHVKLAELATKTAQADAARRHNAAALAVAQSLAEAGRLAPADGWMIEELEMRVAATPAPSGA